MQRCFTNILSEDVNKTASFYEALLGMKRHFDSDWFVVLVHDELNGVELGILDRDNEILPESIRNSPMGVIVTFVVDSCDSLFDKATEMGAQIIEPPTDMFYGQRRLLLRDPDGTVVDISSLIPQSN